MQIPFVAVIFVVAFWMTDVTFEKYFIMQQGEDEYNKNII